MDNCEGSREGLKGSHKDYCLLSVSHVPFPFIGNRFTLAARFINGNLSRINKRKSKFRYSVDFSQESSTCLNFYH